MHRLKTLRYNILPTTPVGQNPILNARVAAASQCLSCGPVIKFRPFAILTHENTLARRRSTAERRYFTGHVRAPGPGGTQFTTESPPLEHHNSMGCVGGREGRILYKNQRVAQSSPSLSQISCCRTIFCSHDKIISLHPAWFALPL